MTNFRLEYPELFEFHGLLIAEIETVREHRAEIEKAFHSTISLIQIPREDPLATNIVRVIQRAGNDLIIYLPPQNAWKGIHPSLAPFLAPALALLEPAVLDQWQKRGRGSALRSMMTALLVLGATYSSMLWIAGCPPETMLDPDAAWMLRLFRLIPEN